MSAHLMPNRAASAEPLDAEWVARIFARMSAMYGAKFTQQWQGVDPKALGAVWAEDLAGYTGAEIKRGLEACKSRQWPPTLPEFCNLCRPQLDPQALLLVAIREMRKRVDRERNEWPDSRTYWAAVRVGGDLLTLAPEKLLRRWELALHEAIADEHKPIPDVAADRALPAPGKTTISKADAARRAEDMARRAGGQKGPEAICRGVVESVCKKPHEAQSKTVEYAISALKFWRMEVPQKLTDRAVELGLIKQEVAA